MKRGAWHRVPGARRPEASDAGAGTVDPGSPPSSETLLEHREQRLSPDDVIVATTSAARQVLGLSPARERPGLHDGAAGPSGPASTLDDRAAPSLARRLLALGAGAVCLIDDDGSAGPDRLAGQATHSLDADAPPLPAVWLASTQASGWLTATPAVPDAPIRPADRPAFTTAFASAFASALSAARDRGFVAADAAVLAMMASTQASRSAPPTGAPAGDQPPSFIYDPTCLPDLSWSETLPPLYSVPAPKRPLPARRLDLYAIVDRADRIPGVLAAGIGTIQLRIKTPAAPEPGWPCILRDEVRRSVAACRAADALLFVNDHWRLARELGADGVHLGQEDLLALDDAGRAELATSELALGISSHSLWELCRARGLGPRYIACGPVWPTLTKAMPWQAQGLDNLAWWCRMAGTPVVAIGGILQAEEVRAAASTGADGVCIVRGLGADPTATVPRLQAALEAGRRHSVASAMQPRWPHPSLLPEST